MKKYSLLLIGLVIMMGNLIAQEDYFKPDTSICEISLLNSESLLKVIPDIDEFINHSGPGVQTSFLNNKGSELLTLIFHSGSNTNQVAEIEVKKFSESSESFERINLDSFITESGIKLYMDKQSLVDKKGTTFTSIIENEVEILTYKINDFTTSKFLSKYNMPEFYAIYFFKKERLIHFKFGFTYP